MRKLVIFLLLFILFIAFFFAFDNYLIKVGESDLNNKMGQIVDPLELLTTEKKLFNASEIFYKEDLLKTRFNGSIIVSKNGKIVFEAYNGLTQINKGESIDSATSFHLASVSKTFTGMAILKLWEEKQLQIDDLLTVYLPTFPYADITLRDLLSHRSGLPNYLYFMETLGWDSHETLTNEELLDFMIKKREKLDVGRRNANFDYCNTNYVLLALVIEKVSKMSYANFLNQTFFKPIGMRNTFVYSPNMQEKVLPSYKFNNQKENFTFLDAVYGDKNIYSTVRDMLKWDIALNNGKLFEKSTLDEAYKGYSYERKGIKNYGLGWRLYEFPSGKKIIYHNGWWHGNNTVFIRSPNDSTTIVVLGNKFNRNIYQAKKILGIYAGYGFQFNEDD